MTPSAQRLLDAIRAAGRPIGYADLCQFTGLTHSNARGHAAKLRTSGAIHIATWKPHPFGGQPSPLFAPGPGDEPDAPPYNAEIIARRLARQRAEWLEQAANANPTVRALLAGQSWLSALLARS